MYPPSLKKKKKLQCWCAAIVIVVFFIEFCKLSADLCNTRAGGLSVHVDLCVQLHVGTLHANLLASLSLHPLLLLQCFVGVVCSCTSGVQMDVLKEMWVAHATGSVNLVRCVFSWTKCLGSEELAQTQFVLRKVSKLSSTGWRFVVALSFVWKSAFTRILLAASCLELLDYVGWSTCKVWGDNVWCGSSCVPARVRMLAIGLLRLARILSTNCRSQPVNIRAFQCWKSQTVLLWIGCRVSVVMFAR